MAPYAIAALAAPQRSDLRMNQTLENEKVVRREIGLPPSLPFSLSSFSPPLSLSLPQQLSFLLLFFTSRTQEHHPH